MPSGGGRLEPYVRRRSAPVAFSGWVSGTLAILVRVKSVIPTSLPATSLLQDLLLCSDSKGGDALLHFAGSFLLADTDPKQLVHWEGEYDTSTVVTWGTAAT